MLNNDIFKNLEPERINIINECIEEMQGKNEMEVLAIVTKALKKFNMSGKPMSNDERNILISSMRSSLPSEHQKKFDMVLGMMGIKL